MSTGISISTTGHQNKVQKTKEERTETENQCSVQLLRFSAHGCNEQFT